VTLDHFVMIVGESLASERARQVTLDHFVTIKQI
jgi:hypothetical protein